MGVLLLSTDSHLKQLYKILYLLPARQVVYLHMIDALDHRVKRTVLLPKALKVAVHTVEFLHRGKLVRCSGLEKITIGFRGEVGFWKSKWVPFVVLCFRLTNVDAVIY